MVDWNSDTDGDGASLLTEYAFGGQPLIAGTSDLVYQLLGSSNLKHWSALSGTEASVTPSITLPGFEEVVFLPSEAVTKASSLFVRLSAQ